MARQTLVLDASVGVKWFSTKDEGGLNQALAIRDSHTADEIKVMVPDLFFYEVINALVHKKSFSTVVIQSAGSSLFALGMSIVRNDARLLAETIRIARQADITVYDALYAAIAIENKCPLVTANPRHQKPGLGCRVISIEEWRPE